MWRKEAFGTLLWALQHLERCPTTGESSSSSISTRRSPATDRSTRSAQSGRLRPSDEIERAWLEADAWFGATEGRAGEDAQVASAAAERFRALSWLRDRDAAPA